MKERTKERLKNIGLTIGVLAATVGALYIWARFGSSSNMGCDDFSDVKDFLENYIPVPGSKNTLFDIDDLELIRENLADPIFRKTYGVSEEAFNQYLLDNI